MITTDTIVAISSAVGVAARMIVRVSGDQAIVFLKELTEEAPTQAGAYRLPLRCPPVLSETSLTFPAWVYVFRSPRSYTGQDLLELHLPGNPLLVQMVVEDLIRRGARLAEPGEFTFRAYIHGRLDLTQAEGVALTIHAANESELRAARQLMSGELARRLAIPMDRLADALALLEAGIDFVEEDISFISAQELTSRIDQVRQEIEQLLRSTARIERITHEPRFVLVGKPNAGKSSLLNALARTDRAVISPVAGTTRDAISAQIVLDRGMVTVIDVAGLEPITHDPHGIQTQMQEQALRMIQQVDFVIQVVDATETDDSSVHLPRVPDLRVVNKIDLKPYPDVQEGCSFPTVRVSAKTGENLSELERMMSQLAFGRAEIGATLSLSARHVTALEECISALDQANTSISTGATELIAQDLRVALEALGRILGQVTPDDLLGRIFSSFCIGK